MQIRILSSLLLPVMQANAVPSECQMCHGESKTETICTNCHTSGLMPTENRNVNGLYKNAPVFNSKQLTELKPFAIIGLQDYLANPIARRRHFGNMYSMSQIQINQFSREFSLWSKPSNYIADSKLVSKGKMLFINAGCDICHGLDGKYPILPIGSAIYNFQYFNFILDGGAPYY